MTRRADRKRSERRILLWSFTAAAALHVAALLFLPGLQPSDAEGGDDTPDEMGVIAGAAIPLDLFFGPPIITGADGRLTFEPPERILSEGRAVFVTASCKRFIEERQDVLSGTVRLTVQENGRVEVVGVVESTGAVCGDDVLERVAGDLWYRWLPNDDFPAPVEVVQPLTFAEYEGA